ncbi:hypothetical protein BAE44_0015770 [Dichanthelium oligosanthes]|uniref:F-box domain-containing protein n=1 Tax=Dichanthelium oligosanthes TaxID=888268 RepID=A0A1E5VDM2_9POAL|nr:hypothetical protein BAE44_0015770 [Dichanthelium oligosanthes]
MTRRLPGSAAPAPALDDDDIMSEILLRLPPLPSSFPRASLVCKRWRRLVSDPHFLHRFGDHHGKPPVLGFSSQWVDVEFTSALDSPDSIPASRFSPRLDTPPTAKSSTAATAASFSSTRSCAISWQSLAAIESPSSAVDFDAWCRMECGFLITAGDGCGLTVLYLSGISAQVWKWKANCDGGTGWMLGSNVDLNNLLSLKAGVDTRAPEILGMAEDDNTMFLSTNVGIFILHLESMQFKNLSITMSHDSSCIHYPFRSFYSAGEYYALHSVIGF